MIYLVVGIDHGSLAPWHENISARTRAAPCAGHRARRGRRGSTSWWRR